MNPETRNDDHSKRKSEICILNMLNRTKILLILQPVKNIGLLYSCYCHMYCSLNLYNNEES